MKRLFGILITLVLFSVLLSACDSTNSLEALENEKPTCSLNETLNTQDKLGGVEPNGVEVPLLTISTLDDYNEFLSSENLPKNFITYDVLKDIGDFVYLIFLSDGYNGDFTEYMYTVKDSTGYDISVYVEPSIESDVLISNTIIAEKINRTDLRTIGSDESGFYMYNDVKYKYVSGKLLSIAWDMDGLRYTVTGSSMLDNYPYQKNTFMGLILNGDTAKDAFRVLETAVRATQD